MKLGKLHTEKGENGSLPLVNHRAPFSCATNVCALNSVSVRKVTKKMFGVSAGRVEQRSLGKSPQNGDRPQTPQALAAFGDGDLIVGMATTYLAFTTDKIISMDNYYVNFQISVFLQKIFFMAAYFWKAVCRWHCPESLDFANFHHQYWKESMPQSSTSSYYQLSYTFLASFIRLSLTSDGELQTSKFKSVFPWKNIYYTMYIYHIYKPSSSSSIDSPHWTQGKTLNTLISKHFAALTHNPCIARYFSYCRFALKLDEMLHVSKFYIPPGQKTLHTPPLAQVRERKPWALLHVMPFSRLCIHWEASCKKKGQNLPHTSSLHLFVW